MLCECIVVTNSNKMKWTCEFHSGVPMAVSTASRVGAGQLLKRRIRGGDLLRHARAKGRQICLEQRRVDEDQAASHWQATPGQ
jgi:hypothetical protein